MSLFVAAGNHVSGDTAGVVLAGEREAHGVTVDRRSGLHRGRCGHVPDGEGLNFAPLADILVLVDGADFIGVFTDRKVADVQCGLARFQDFSVVEQDFVVRHFAGVVHAGVPEERRLVFAVHDRNGKAGHPFRRSGIPDRDFHLAGLTCIAGRIEGGYFRMIFADSEMVELHGGSGCGFDLTGAAHFIVFDADIVGAVPRDYAGVAVDCRRHFPQLRSCHVGHGDRVRFAPFAGVSVRSDHADAAGVPADRNVLEGELVRLRHHASQAVDQKLVCTIPDGRFVPFHGDGILFDLRSESVDVVRLHRSRPGIRRQPDGAQAVFGLVA